MYIVVVLKLFCNNLCKNNIDDVKWLENVVNIMLKYDIVVLKIY